MIRMLPRSAVMVFILFLLLSSDWLTVPARAQTKPADPAPAAAKPALVAVSGEMLRDKQQSQERARAMAAELVSAILDIQLRQLEENGLQKLEIYRDIAAMRKNIDVLVESEMLDVVAILEKAQKASPEQKQKDFDTARGKIREIVLRLAIERQNLSKRLKVAELALQVKRLIELENSVVKTTEVIPTLAALKQGEATVSAIHDQRDVQTLFLHLVQTLRDVSTWEGAVGAGAADGLQILKAAQVGQELDQSGQQLESGAFVAAVKSEKNVVAGLRLLLKKLEETQGLISTDHEAALAMVREMIKREEALRKETKKADLAKQGEKLSDDQLAIHEDLGKLTDALQKLPGTLSLLEQAKSAALEARTDLFEAKRPQAEAEEGRVLGNLAQIEQQLQNAVDAANSDKTADQLFKQVRDLQAAKEDLKKANAKEQAAKEAVKDKPAEAKAAQQQVAEDLKKAEENRDLGAAVESRINQAAEAAKEAAAADDQKAKPAAENAADAVERAAAEVDAALADAKRRALAVKVGELARAAEALERSAAAEKDVAHQSDDAAKAGGLKAEEAQKLAAEQADVKQVAKKIAQGIENTAPEAAKTLNEAKAPIDAAAAKLAEAERHPGETSKPAAASAAEQSKQAANTLEKTAAQLRGEIDKTAEQLARIAGQQLEQVAKAREDVEKAAGDTPESIADRLEKLAAAEDKVRQAAADQERAAGRSAAADAKDLAREIDKAIAQQKSADQAAKELAEGRANDSFDATLKQQSAADKAGEAAKHAATRPQAAKDGKPDALAENLKKAQEAGNKAAKEALNGSAKEAEKARQDARNALDAAKQMAQAESKRAAEAPARPADAAAQKRVGEAAKEAGKLSAADAPLAADSLGKAEHTSAEAEKAAAAGDKAAAAPSQKSTAENLDKAAEQIAAARMALAQKDAGKLDGEAMQLASLAKEVAPVDPGANAALRAAEKAAEKGAAQNSAGKQSKPADQKPGEKPDSDAKAAEAAASSPEEVAGAQAQVERGLQRAAASLNAREQQIQRDKAIAEALRGLQKEQQADRDEIVAKADELKKDVAMDEAAAEKADSAAPAEAAPSADAKTQPGKANGAKPAPASAKTQAAAQALTQAQNRFAQAQTATGQAAAEISGQQEVANQPIREGLDAASKLPTGDAAAAAADAPPMGEQPGEPDQGEKPGEGQTPGEGKTPGQGQDKPGQGKPGQGLGNGFVPSSPQATAAAIAGPGANAQAAAAMSQAQGQQPGQGQGQQPGQQPGQTSANAKAGGAPKGGKPQQNAEIPPGELQLTDTKKDGDTRTADSDRDANAAARKALKEEAWMAKLPPEVRDAIRARAGRPAPRGYEERLRRYFEKDE